MAYDPFDKPFSWSYSKLKNFETCGHRHLQIDLLRVHKEDEKSGALLWGNQLHDAMASAIGTDDNNERKFRDQIKDAPLPDSMSGYQPWVSRIRNARASGSRVTTELSYAITRDFKPTGWMEHNTWFRTKVDAEVTAAGGEFAAAWDWKTGKRVEDSVQLMLTALTIMIHKPAIRAVRTEFVWLADMIPARPFDCVDRVSFTREQMPDMWSQVARRVAVLEQAWLTREYPKNPGRLCKRFCAVTSCEHHGR